MTRPVFVLALAVAVSVTTLVHADKPSFDCGKVKGSVEELICADSALAALDVQMDGVWHEVLARSQDNLDLDLIKAEQRGWVKGRNDCWKNDDVRTCVETSYKLRIAELQARWRLVPANGPFFFFCDDNPANEVVASFFDTDPPAAVLEHGDEVVVAFLQPSASGAKYQGRNVTFWTKGEAAMVTWGWEAEEMKCKLGKRTE